MCAYYVIVAFISSKVENEENTRIGKIINKIAKNIGKFGKIIMISPIEFVYKHHNIEKRVIWV